MTISKNLLFIFFCAFGTQVVFPYFNAAVLKTEAIQIIEFADELFKHNTEDTRKAAKWLKKQMDNDFQGQVLNDTDILEIAKEITANTTLDAKMVVISKKIAEHANKQIANAEKRFDCFQKWANQRALEYAALGFVSGMCVVAGYDAMISKIVYEVSRHR